MLRCSPACLKALLSGLTLCLVLGTSGFVVWQSIREHDLALEAANRQLLGNARALAEHAGQSLAVAERTLSEIHAAIEQQGGRKQAEEHLLHELMQRKVAGMRQVGSALLVDAAGQGIANSHEYPLKPMQVVDREYYRHHRDNPTSALFLGRPVKSRVLGAWVFTISRRLDTPDGSFDGLAAVSFRVAYFDQFYQSVSMHQDIQTLLLRTDGWPLAVTPANEQAFQVNIRGKLLLSKLVQETPYGVFRNQKALLDNADRQIAFARLEAPFENLVAVVSLPREVILADWQRQVAVNVGGALVLMSFSVGLAVLLLQRLRDLEQKETEVGTLNERLTLATEAGGVGVWDWDLPHNRLYWDRQMYHLYGLTEHCEEECYHLFQQAVHPEDLERAEEAMHEALYGEAPLDVEFRVVRCDTGELRHLRCIARVYRNPAGEAVRVVGINLDVTERRRAELYLNLAKDEAEQANRLKSSFIASVSHELRTPLNAIVGMSHLLTRSELTARQREQLETIDSAGRTLLAIINDLLDISRIEAGRFDLELIPFSLSRLLAEQTGLVKGRAEEKGVRLSSHSAADIPDRLEGDPLRLGQILMNLLSNAVKFTDQGQISVGVTLAGRQDEKLLLCFQVKDSGIGIPRDRLREIFSPFTQSDNSIARRYGGTGLGLAISSQLVKLMGGEIGVESEEGAGSLFFFTVPLRPSDAAAAVDNSRYAAPPPTLVDLSPPVAPASLDRDRLQPLLKKLEQQLKGQNMGAVGTFHQFREQLGGRFSGELVEMEELLERLEFSKAASILHRLAEKLGIP
ncbi:hybrid sensor histidine kinase/response regulator [Trichlorobacter ammonificans]|uniref:histidine kinase n=1 Tax=Trichlorobacter ammonificans TaxID=2916410 RepID=A0ABM9DAV7_9BACT|nr:ATP-binding protein [Trichlorobacter ammonificans]CAH2032373.1 putative Histidine kinase [Trichlorobacter ammonificans]